MPPWWVCMSCLSDILPTSQLDIHASCLDMHQSGRLSGGCSKYVCIAWNLISGSILYEVLVHPQSNPIKLSEDRVCRLRSCAFSKRCDVTLNSSKPLHKSRLSESVNRARRNFIFDKFCQLSVCVPFIERGVLLTTKSEPLRLCAKCTVFSNKSSNLSVRNRND